MSKSVIVIGADGTIGRALVDTLAGAGRVVYSTTRRRSESKPNSFQLDLTSSEVETVELPKVDTAIFCAAVTSFYECRKNPALARQVNVVAPTLLARRLVSDGTKVLLLSTSAVFDWRTPHVRADHLVCPTTVYGTLKAEAEDEFGALGSTAAILRLTKILTPDHGLMRNWVYALDRKNPVTAYADLHMAPVTLEDVIAALTAIIDGFEPGLFQLSGAFDIDYYQAATRLAVNLGVDPKFVTKAYARDNGVPDEEIMLYTSLDTSRISKKTGWNAPDPYSVVDNVFKSIKTAAL